MRSAVVVADVLAEHPLGMPLAPDQERIAVPAPHSRERPGHTLSPTALVSEAFLGLVDHEQPAFNDRVHFVAVAARHMRQILDPRRGDRGLVR
jgi:hypothetical protein